MESNLMMSMEGIEKKDAKNTLSIRPQKCIGCGRCVEVCPHGVFAIEAKRAKMVNGDGCMECGACKMNCPTGAIDVDSGVGCAGAMIRSALTGKEVSCGDPGCC